MAAYNKVILMGRLVKDPDLRVTTLGVIIANICIAISRKFKTKTGELKDSTVFVDAKSFGQQAETIAKYLSKGRPILIEGHLDLQKWQTQDGQKRQKLCVNIEKFEFVDSKPSGGQCDTSPAPSSEKPAQPKNDGLSEQFDDDEHLPF